MDVFSVQVTYRDPRTRDPSSEPRSRPPTETGRNDLEVPSFVGTGSRVLSTGRPGSTQRGCESLQTKRETLSSSHSPTPRDPQGKEDYGIFRDQEDYKDEIVVRDAETVQERSVVGRKNNLHPFISTRNLELDRLPLPHTYRPSPDSSLELRGYTREVFGCGGQSPGVGCEGLSPNASQLRSSRKNPTGYRQRSSETFSEKR